ncbi:hypothetical protein GCM10011332_30590 [Terasakiella brassicae]|uniref:Uncharacterized protein n=1 Tax=Terasakiella brassicae TaxID=1634917 RepID=A0A917FG28_9PROT|nr:hypothetical protein GCM10011332_30590 [Terasakiella brassicae]
MDPQMVWDMMDECDDQAETPGAMSATSEIEDKVQSKPELSRKISSGFMGFPVLGFHR